MMPRMITMPLMISLLAASPYLSVQEDSPQDDVRLVVLVVVDQMIPEQLERMQPWLHGGLERFAKGEVWRRAAHGHSKTETGPGHASIGTGMFPNHSAIVANIWTDYASGQSIYCVGDPEARLLTSAGLGAKGTATSSKNLAADGFAEFLRAANPGAKSISVAGKDRAAILASGRRADLALWWERTSGAGFCSSDAYAESLPGWVNQWNASWVEQASGWSWDASLEGLQASGMAADLRPGEPRAGFPHVAPELGDSPTHARRSALARWAYGSPLVDQFVLELAAQAVVAEELGSDGSVDFLFVGLSACDTLGHTYGPYSHEVTDLMLRIDEGLGELFALLDERVGEQRWIAALSADHGVLPLPEALPAKLLPGRRVNTNALGRASNQLRLEIEEVFGAPYFLGLDYTQGRLDVAALQADGIDPDEVSQMAIESLLQSLPWMHAGYTRKQLIEAQREDSAGDTLLTLSARSFHPERSLDFQMIPKPWVLISPFATGTSHGSPWPYDTRVPIAFIGPGSKRGSQRFEACLTVDILPTLLQRAGLKPPPGLDGRVLH